MPAFSTIKELAKRLFHKFGVGHLPKVPEDELIGFWENDADDGSGLHAIWGFGIEFQKNGKGVYRQWGRVHSKLSHCHCSEWLC